MRALLTRKAGRSLAGSGFADASTVDPRKGVVCLCEHCEAADPSIRRNIRIVLILQLLDDLPVSGSKILRIR